MEDKADIVAADMAETFSGSMPEYDKLVYTANSTMRFRGKTIDEWMELIALPELKEELSIHELEEFNRRFLNMNEIIMSNLSTARLGYESIKAHYIAKLLGAKRQIMVEIDAYNDNPNHKTRKRVPGADSLEDQAKTRCVDTYVSLKIAEMFLEFWKVMYEKLKLIDNRLTGMNILKNVESKLGSG